MSILTEVEIAHIAGAESRNVMEFARAIESAVLEKLAGMEMPEPVQIGLVEVDWNHFKPAMGFTAAQLHQAYAQGVASQLSQVPFGIWHVGDTEEESDFYVYEDSGDVSCENCIKLYTLKEAK